MEQFLKSKDGLYNLRRVDKIVAHYKEMPIGNIPTIQLKRGGHELPMVEILYSEEKMRAHDMKVILGGLKNGTNLIELEYG